MDLGIFFLAKFFNFSKPGDELHLAFLSAIFISKSLADHLLSAVFLFVFLGLVDVCLHKWIETDFRLI
jgi:hypothetical protein